MTINTGTGDGGYNFEVGDEITVTDPGNTSNTAVFVVSGVKHDMNYQFWNCGKGASNFDWNPNPDEGGWMPGKTNFTWEYEGSLKVCWKLEFSFEDLDLLKHTESNRPGRLTGYDNMLNHDQATDESGLQFRVWHPPHDKFYMCRLYTNGGVPVSDVNMSVKNFFNDYCVQSSWDYFGPLVYHLNQGYYFKMENFTDNPSAGWSE